MVASLVGTMKCLDAGRATSGDTSSIHELFSTSPAHSNVSSPDAKSR